VAEVNIDAKLLARRQMADEDEAYEDTVELENGCACCTAGPDLMDSILKLVRLSIRRDIVYDRIVVEMSGVSEPRNLRDDFQDSRETHQVFKYVDLETMLTVVDSSHFLELYTCKDDIKQVPDLVMTEKEKQSTDAHIDSERRVVDLLVEMIECADYVILNKTDRVSEEHQTQLGGIAQSLNPSATTVACAWGKVPLHVVLGAPQGVGVCKVVDHTKEDIKRAVTTFRSNQGTKRLPADSMQDDPSASPFGHVSFGQVGNQQKTAAAGAKDMPGPRGLPEAKKQRVSARQQTSAADRFGITTFVYSRRRPFHPARLLHVLNQLPVKVDAAGNIMDTWQLPSSLAQAAAAGCGQDSGAAGLAAPGGLPAADSGNAASAAAAPSQEAVVGAKSDMHTVIRSKGFAWIANSPQKMNYWSHAGHFFSLEYLHDWWAATPIYEWPRHPDDIAKILDDFAPEPTKSSLQGSDCAAPSESAGDGVYVGDRRQEIVYIGIDMDRGRIEQLLDKCLLSDEEMKMYVQQEANKNLVEIDWSATPARVIGVPGYTEPPPEEKGEEEEEEEEDDRGDQEGE